MFGLTGNIPSNTSVLRAQRAYQSASQRRAQSLNQMATGLRINRASDDPAGLIAAEGLRQTLAALDAETSANERASQQARTAESALGEVSDLLTQAKTLTNANANSVGLSDDEKAANQLEIDSILSTVDRLSSSTSFGGQKLLNGSATLSASGTSLAVASSTTSSLGTTDISGTTYTLADVKSGGALAGQVGGISTVIDKAINDVSTQRATLGAFDKYTLQPRLSSVASSREQLVSAVSMLRDTDYALAASQQSRNQILQRSSLATLRKAQGRRSVSTFSILG